jgi:hypothetical protein
MTFAYVLVYLTLLYLFFSPIPRGLIFVLPLFAVFAGYAADVLFRKVAAVTAGSTVFYFICPISLFILLFGWQIITDFRYDWLVLQKDTRLAAQEWVSLHIPEGTKILVDSQYLRFTNTKKGIGSLERIDPSGLRAADEALLQTPSELYPRPAYNVLNLHFVSAGRLERETRDLEFFRMSGFRYFIVEHDYADSRDLPEATRELIRGLRPIARFDNGAKQPSETALDIGGEISTVPLRGLFNIKRFGKFVEIYEF